MWNNELDNFKNYLKFERRMSENTISSYLRDLNKLKTFSEKYSKNPLNIEYDFIQDFLLGCGNISSRSQARLISSIKAFFKYLQIEERRQDNPSEIVETPKIGFRLPDTLSHEEIRKIIDSVDLSDPEGERNRAILETLYACGLRVSELIQLKISDIYPKEQFISIFGKGNKKRLVPISERALSIILRYKDYVRVHQKIQNKNILFLNRRGEQLTREMIFLIVRKAAKKAGIEKKISPHTFRHSYASVLLENGADLFSIKQLLGHESITTTEIYTHLELKQLRNTIEKHHPYYIKNNIENNIKNSDEKF